MWIKNEGTKPAASRVDIRLDIDEPEWPGVPFERADQDPNDWDWMLLQSPKITHYRVRSK